MGTQYNLPHITILDLPELPHNVEMVHTALVRADEEPVLIMEELRSGIKDMQYSEELIEECKKIFKEEYNLDLTSETASKYLHSLGRFLFACSEIDAQKEIREKL